MLKEFIKVFRESVLSHFSHNVPFSEVVNFRHKKFQMDKNLQDKNDWLIFTNILFLPVNRIVCFTVEVCLHSAC